MLKHLTQGDPAPDDLTPYWNDAIEHHHVIYPWGDKVRWVRSLMEHIVAKGYSKRLYPYASIGGLLVSFPRNGLINYDPTLRVFYDDLQQQPMLRSRPGHWEKACQAPDVIDTFEQFLNAHPDWSDAARAK